MDFEKERAEALAAAKSALSSLEKARSMLSSARGWEIYDTFFSGGVFSGVIKHSKMNERKNISNTQKMISSGSAGDFRIWSLQE